ncbi:hypothetical protein JCM21531_2948 [Acetivibrio straminisolvens JCM 21531]|uniref:Uncharacterized protein n=1 Tax=Acetivibrio straminisolvens JCM 21531 TaxID=1294263 RepID=W4V9F2_9FIRM|nr:hypothetical protein JCM21531_2948 [Acetivibrio straminisolvens JCM 21531]
MCRLKQRLESLEKELLEIRGGEPEGMKTNPVSYGMVEECELEMGKEITDDETL